MKDLESLPTLRIRGVIASREDDSVYGETTSAADVIDFLDANKEATEIVVDISSNGGSVAEGKEIFTRLKNSGKKITTITHRAMSVATLIMLAGSKRLIVEQGDFLIHAANVESLDGPLGADDLIKIAQEVSNATEDILNFYCRILGEDKRMQLMAAMAKDSNLGAREAIKLGFATGYYKKTADVSNAAKPILITAHYSELIKNKTMAADKDLMKSIDEKITNSFKAFFKGFMKIKNQVSLTLSSGQAIYVEPASPDAPDDLVGGKVFQVDEAGLPTSVALPDGEHALEDGRVLVVTGGVISEVKESVDASKLQEEVENLKAQLAEKEAALTAQAAAKDAEVIAAKAETEAVKVEASKQVSAIKMQFEEFKKAIPGAPLDKKDDPIDEPDMSKMTTAQKVRMMSKQRAKLEM